MAETEVCDYPENFKRAYINGLKSKEELSKWSIDTKKGTVVETSSDKYESDESEESDEDQKTLEIPIQKLLEKKKLSDFTHCELQLIWEAPLEDLKTRLNLESDEDVDFLRGLCCDLFLFYDNYREAPTMDELLKREKDWEQKLNRTLTKNCMTKVQIQQMEYSGILRYTTTAVRCEEM